MAHQISPRLQAYPCDLDLREQLGYRKTESLRNQFQIEQANVPLAPLQVGKVAPIQAQLFGHLNLSPALSFSQFPNPLPESHTYVFGHQTESWLVGSE